MAEKTAEHILTQVKGLSAHLQADEQPLLALPAIWDNDREKRGTPCDVIITDQRLLGYYRANFPRERIFLDALPLAQIRNVSLRERSFEPIFRELMVSANQRKVYIRAPRQKIEQLYAELRSAIETYAQNPALESELESMPAPEESVPAPVFGRQEIRTEFERSNTALMLLFVAGVVLEIGGALLWGSVGQSIGLPLCIAGFVMVFAAVVQRRQQRR
ncbi:MAG TPA: hypothetical protein VGU68_02475 [Ktedonobacteraceae bacterium]|nr:hypothetical protein [Ktedonobacteraceae bacterium]